LHDLLASQGQLEEVRGLHPELFQELNLNASTEELLRSERAFTYADLHAMLESGKKMVAWLTPHAALVSGSGRLVSTWDRIIESCRFCFSVDGKCIIALARSPEHLLESCDIILRMLAVSEVHRVILNSWRCPNGLINAPNLTYLMEQCQKSEVFIIEESGN
jgi:hypothetical protein